MLKPSSIILRLCAAAGGDINAAAANLLLGVNPLGPPPIAALAQGSGTGGAGSGARSVGGVPQSMARAFMAEVGGDSGAARAALVRELGAAAAERSDGDGLGFVGGGAASRPLPSPGSGTGSASGSRSSSGPGGDAFAAVAGAPESFDCSICLLSVPAAAAGTLACGHAFCLECLRSHVKARMADGESAVILCPHSGDGDASSGCGVAITQRELRALLGSELFAVLDRRALEQAVAVDPSLHICPSE